MSGNVTELTDVEFDHVVHNSEVPVLVDFWAPWCGPCVMMAPILEDLAEEFDGRLKIGKLNVGLPENQPLASQYQIQSIPNMKLFKNGKVVKDFVGSRPKEIFKTELENEL
jgi:thioredoxin 1